MATSDTIPPEHPHLHGEAPRGLYGFEDETGSPLEGGEAIIPLLELIDGNQWRFIGTGFFITSLGLFATAKHVLKPAYESGLSTATWQLIPPNQYLIRPVDQLSFHETADLAIGVVRGAAHVETEELLINPRLRITTKVQAIGDIVATYAYPNTVIVTSTEGQILSFQPRFYEGQITEHLPNGRDRLRLPGPCYRTSMVIHHGASGGPVAGPTGRVFAVNSTGFDGTADSYVSQIDDLLSLEIIVPGNHRDERITIEQLAEQGDVTLDL